MAAATPKKNAIFSLYRSFLREIRHLPEHHLRQFFRFKVQDDIRAILGTAWDQPQLRRRKFRRVEQTLRRVQSANQGDERNFEHILELAYGRKGRIRREILEPLLNDPSTPKPPRLVNHLPRSRPPAYPPAFAALVLSEHSRSNASSLRPSHLVNPPTLPPRANPSSMEAKYFGPFSKRREVNIRWRFFTKQYKRVLPPLQLEVKTSSASAMELLNLPHSSLGFSNVQGLQFLERMVGAPAPSRPLTRRERLGQKEVVSPPLPERHPSRWLRRRYQHLLAKIPILQFNPSNQKYSIQPHPQAYLPSASGRVSAPRLVDIDDSDKQWLTLHHPQSKK